MCSCRKDTLARLVFDFPAQVSWQPANFIRDRANKARPLSGKEGFKASLMYAARWDCSWIVMEVKDRNEKWGKPEQKMERLLTNGARRKKCVLYVHVAKKEVVAGQGRKKTGWTGDSRNKKLIFPMVAHQFQWWYRGGGGCRCWTGQIHIRSTQTDARTQNYTEAALISALELMIRKSIDL